MTAGRGASRHGCLRQPVRRLTPDARRPAAGAAGLLLPPPSSRRGRAVQPAAQPPPRTYYENANWPATRGRGRPYSKRYARIFLGGTNGFLECCAWKLSTRTVSPCRIDLGGGRRAGGGRGQVTRGGARAAGCSGCCLLGGWGWRQLKEAGQRTRLLPGNRHLDLLHDAVHSPNVRLVQPGAVAEVHAVRPAVALVVPPQEDCHDGVEEDAAAAALVGGDRRLHFAERAQLPVGQPLPRRNPVTAGADVRRGTR